MSNEAIHEFIRTKLNEQITGDNASLYVFGGSHLYSYANGELTLETKNYDTLQIDKKQIIPFTILSFDGERIPLSSVTIFKHVLPVVFSFRVNKRQLWETFVESFANAINGLTFTIDGVNTAFSCSNISATQVEKEHDNDLWIDMTITVFAYQGNIMLGNNVTISLNGTTIEPLSYITTMQNEQSYRTKNNLFYGTNRSNGKQHRRSVVYLQPLDDDTWVKEIEGDLLNTNYAFNVTYPFTTPYQAFRVMRLDTGVATVQNGTSVLLELTFVDGD